MFAIATLINNIGTESKFYNGILYPLPVELCDPPRIRAYSNIVRSGWGVSEFGYHYFSIGLSRGKFFVFPGLILEGGSKPTKKFYGYSESFSKSQIEEFAHSIIDNFEQADQLAQKDLGMLVHDLRVLSNAIYNSALEALPFLEAGNVNECKTRIESIIASQGILKMRTDALDFVGNVLHIQNDEDIPIYKKIDKVARCFKSRAKSQNRILNFGGYSYRKVSGPDLLELVPYGLIDNALKYCPEGGTVSIEVIDHETYTTMTVSSFGPKIFDDEVQRLFRKGERGRAAMASTVPGTGFGLFMVHKIVTELFDGQISVHQVDVPTNISGSVYFLTTFSIHIPSF